MNISEFERLLTSIKRCYANKFQNKLPGIDDFDSGSLIDTDNNWYRSVALRIEVIRMLMETDAIDIDVRAIWPKLSESIKILPGEAFSATIGSQGFLSIPLYKFDSELNNFEFIRLHIWDESINKYVNKDTRDNFSIHSHAFNAKSIILCGELINERFKVKESLNPTGKSYFKINYDSTLNNINRHTSTANNTSEPAIVQKISCENYYPGGTYFIKAGEFHKSGVNEYAGTAATIFLFKSDNRRPETSFVIGPDNVLNSEVNREVIIDPIDLIEKIDQKILRI